MGGGGGGSGEERMDLQNVLAGMDQQQLMQLLNLVGGGSGGGLDSPLLGGSGSTPAVTSSARSAASITPAVVSSAAAPSATATVTTASTGSSQATSGTTGDAQTANQKPIQVADLRNILSNMTIPTAATRSADDVDIQSVAEILEMEGSGGGGQSVEGNKRAKEDDGASPKEPSAKKDKPDDDPMDLD